MHARCSPLTFLPCALAATLPLQILNPLTVVPSTNLTLSPQSITASPSLCFDTPIPGTPGIYRAYLPDCERAATQILRSQNPFATVTFSQAAGSGFVLPADFRYRTCWISLGIGPLEVDEFRPEVAYLGAWELARECTSGMHQFGGVTIIGPRNKVYIHINGLQVSSTGAEEGAVAGMEARNGSGNVVADE